MLHIEMVETEDAFAALEMQWEELAGRVSDAAFMQSFAWCHLTWMYSAKKASDRLKCLSAWDGERLVAVWPCIERRVLGVRKLVQLGFGIGDYSRPLIDPYVDTLDTCRLLLGALARHADAMDIICLDFSPAMQAALMELSAMRRIVRFEDFSVDPHRRGSWHAFMASLSKNMRNHLQSSRKKLAERGAVTFSIARSPESQLQVIDWTLMQKQAWLKRHDRRNDWYADPNTRAFLIEAAQVRNGTGYMAIFSLQLDGVILASWFGSINRERIGALMITFDIEYHRFSPGMLLIQDVVHWGYASNLVADLGGEEAEFKERWATDRLTRVAYCYGLSLPGIIYQLWTAFREVGAPALKSILPSALIRLAGRTLKRLRSRGALSAAAVMEDGHGKPSH